MDNIETLLERFIEDRDHLDDGELDALVEAAERDPHLAARLKDQLVIDELLGQRLAIDRRNFVAQVAQRIRDDELAPIPPEPADPNITADMRQLLDVELAKQQQEAKRRSASRWQWVAIGLALVLLAGTGLWWWQMIQQPIAVVEHVRGAPTLVRGNQSRPLQPNETLRLGDEVATLPAEEVRLRYRDGSELQLAGDTTLRLSGEASGEGKRVELSWGTVLAEVVPQPPGRPMKFTTPLSVATVRGTRLWLTGDQRRTRLDVLEGLVELQRIADGETIPVRAREFAIATPEELAVQPLSWPVDRRDAIVVLETADATSLVRNATTRKFEPIDLQPRGEARLDHNFALVLTGGSYLLQNASAAVLQSCRQTNEFTIEATISPRFAQRATPTIIAACGSGDRFNFILGQEADRLFLRLQTSAPPPAGEGPFADDGRIDLCRLTAGQPQHVVVAYRSGELDCYLNGRRVYRESRLQGDFSAWERLPVTLGADQRGGSDWAGTLEGFAIYDRFLPGEEVRRNARLYRQMIAQRHEVPQVELQATLLEKSPVPTAEEISPARSALVVSRWRVDGVLRGSLAQSQVLVAQWAVLNGQPQAIAELQPGAKRRMTVERLGLNAQLETVLRIDRFNTGDDPQKPRYYEVSDPSP